MNINDGLRAIFIHNPRCAGSSIEIALGLDHGHDTVSQSRARHGGKWDEYFSFSFARNPINRLISTYEFAQADKSWYHDNLNPGPAGSHGDAHPDYATVKGKSLDECCRMLHANPSSLKHPGWLPQTHFIPDPTELDFVGRFENLDADWKHVCRKLGVDIALPRINETERLKDRTEYLTPFTCAFAASFYKADYVTFGYSLPIPIVPYTEPEPMTAARMAHGAVGIARALTGTGGATDEMVKRRTGICAACDHAEMVKGILQRCKLCGCSTWAKVRNASEVCPDGKW